MQMQEVTKEIANDTEERMAKLAKILLKICNVSQRTKNTAGNY